MLCSHILSLLAAEDFVTPAAHWMMLNIYISDLSFHFEQ